MTGRANALRTIRLDHPERVMGGPPSHGLACLGRGHEGYEALRGAVEQRGPYPLTPPAA